MGVVAIAQVDLVEGPFTFRTHIHERRWLHSFVTVTGLSSQTRTLTHGFGLFSDNRHAITGDYVVVVDGIDFRHDRTQFVAQQNSTPVAVT